MTLLIWLGMYNCFSAFHKLLNSIGSQVQFTDFVSCLISTTQKKHYAEYKTLRLCTLQNGTWSEKYKGEIRTYRRCNVAWYNMLPIESIIFDTWSTQNLFSKRCLSEFKRPMNAKRIPGAIEMVLKNSAI